MSKKRGRGSPSDKVLLNVGGEIFQTSISTLTANSAFFARKFSSDWGGASADEAAADEIFLDRDADSFRVLLSCMRHRVALLPEADTLLCTRVLLEAQYLGVDWLLEQVKSTAHRHMEPTAEIEPAERPAAFDEATGGLEEALRTGVLPARFFGPKKRGLERVKQIIPAGDKDAVVIGEDDNEDDKFRAVCYALIEGERGETCLEPVLAITSGGDQTLDADEERFKLASDVAAENDTTWALAEGGVQHEYLTVAAYDRRSGASNLGELDSSAKDGYYVKQVYTREEDSTTQVLMERTCTRF